MEHPGHTIRDAREAQGLSLQELARRSGTNASYLSKVERGQRMPTRHWLKSVTDALGEHLAQRWSGQASA
jgi:transcriptional regulator with XRE-family HTH domain